MSFYGLDSYELIKEQDLGDIQSKGYVLRHKKSGARVCLISNDDDNKAFYIGFKTPPTDGTGVAHIIEHTVLCGSDKFPVKDPFIELAKGSLNTFLNAMTYPDKTVYPVASYNTKDFENLMDVYLDAVFHPNILKYKEIFEQEGWHYELEDENSPLMINGVVYNEMKGAYSSPDEVLQTKISEALFPHTTYSKNSGGDPKEIPNLTYEKYIAFYKKFYHASNSYIYLYGDFDIKERLQWMDEEYLSEFSETKIDSEIAREEAFDEVKTVVAKYPIASEESEENNSYFAYSKVVDTVLNKELYQAFEVLDYALVSAPGAAVKEALIHEGIGQDVYGGFDSYIYQPVYNIYAKNTNSSDLNKFAHIIEETLRKVAAEGINENSLLAGINSLEFRFREADFGQFPKGLLYGMQCLDSWIFDDHEPFMHLQCLDTFEFLKQQIGTGYFEELIQRYLLDNTHGAIVSIEPEKGLGQKQEEELEEKLAEYKRNLSKEEINTLILDTKHLKEYQEEPSSEEDLKKIPMLTRKDLRREANPFDNIEENLDEVKVVHHNIFSNGIDYVVLMFDIRDIPFEDIPYIGLLKYVLGCVDTAHYSYRELANAVNIYTGGIGTTVSLYPKNSDKNQIKLKFEIRFKMLHSRLKEGVDIVTEIINSSNFKDTKRLSELITECKSKLQASLSSMGHLVAGTRSLSYISEYAYYQELLGGISYYDAICEMSQLVKENPKTIVHKLETLMKRIFVKNRLLISYTADEKDFKESKIELGRLIGKLETGTLLAEKPVFKRKQKNEGIMDASAIHYVARSGNFIDHGYSYTGALCLLKSILGYDYLWMNVRVKGGAYGCMSKFTKMGDAYFVSYRDPNLRKTNEVYDGIPDYIRNFHADERDMTKYIIGTFGALDVPLNPDAKGNRSMTAYLQEVKIEDAQRTRNEILDAQCEDIQALADLVASVLEEDNFCVLGKESSIKAEKDMFKNIRNLTQNKNE